MGSAYFDTSALMKLLRPEAGSEIAMSLWDRSAHLHLSRLGYVEVLAAIAAAERDERLTPLRAATARRRWSGRWAGIRPVELSESVSRAAGILAAEHRLTGADAVHLASARAIANDQTIFATWDRRLHAAGRATGLRVAPDSLD